MLIIQLILLMKTYPINVSQEILFLTYSVMIIEIKDEKKIIIKFSWLKSNKAYAIVVITIATKKNWNNINYFFHVDDFIIKDCAKI